MKLNPPYYSKICTTTSLFCFLIKDVLEYSGLIYIEKKSQLNLVYKSYQYFLDTFEIKIKQLEGVLGKF